VRLADAHGIATEYWSFFGERVHVPAPTLRAVLTAMGVAAETDAEVADALAAADERPWLALLPPPTSRGPACGLSSSMSSTATTSL
jgi:4-alpha-glucanotransferase